MYNYAHRDIWFQFVHFKGYFVQLKGLEVQDGLVQ